MPKKLSSVTEAQLVKDIAYSLAMPQSDVKKVIDAFKEEVVDHLVSGTKVNLVGFGSWTPVYVKPKRKGEMVRNPSTGEEAPRAKAVDAAFKVKASASPSLKTKFPKVKTAPGAKLEKLLK